MKSDKNYDQSDNQLKSLFKTMDDLLTIYKNQEGNIKIDVRLDNESVWLTQEQMATLFGKGRSTITEHIRNVFSKNELEVEAISR